MRRFRVKFSNLTKRFVREPLAKDPVWVTLFDGIEICIDSKHTLYQFANLFVSGEYSSALELTNQPSVVVDIGANRGLFTLLAAHYLRQRSTPLPRFICVEAAKTNYLRLQAHIQANSLQNATTLIHGAVTGKREGHTSLYFNPRSHGMSTITQKRRLLTTERVDIIDLSRALNDVANVDLMKIDIEGSEQAMIQEYPDILKRVAVLVVEFHFRQVDYQVCKDTLKQCGLHFFSRTSEIEGIQSVDIFVRS